MSWLVGIIWLVKRQNNEITARYCITHNKASLLWWNIWTFPPDENMILLWAHSLTWNYLWVKTLFSHPANLVQWVCTRLNHEYTWGNHLRYTQWLRNLHNRSVTDRHVSQKPMSHYVLLCGCLAHLPGHVGLHVARVWLPLLLCDCEQKFRKTCLVCGKTCLETLCDSLTGNYPSIRPSLHKSFHIDDE